MQLEGLEWISTPPRVGISIGNSWAIKDIVINKHLFTKMHWVHIVLGVGHANVNLD